MPQTLSRPDGHGIAYHQHPAGPAGQDAPGVVFLGGFMSDMAGTKATTLEAWCRARDLAFVRFDYFGHGESTGAFQEGTLSRWRDDALAVLDNLTTGPQVLVGSSMGGHIALQAAVARAARIAGLVGVAAAPDLTEDLIWAELDERERAAILEAGVYHRTTPDGSTTQPITRALIEDGRDNLIMRAPIAYDGPVRLLHGMRDDDVPWELAPRLATTIAGEDVSIGLIKDGDHRLSRPGDLARICQATAELTGAPA